MPCDGVTGITAADPFVPPDGVDAEVLMGRAALRLAALLTALACVFGVVAPTVAARRATGRTGTRTATAASGFHLDLYRPGIFATQYRWTWCVGASSQAMLNIVRGTTNRSIDRQRTLVKYAMGHDQLLHSSRGGSDATGWARTLNHFGGGSYRTVLSTSYATAVRRAAMRLRVTGRPVGLLVMGGRHAWVMTGFDATADPQKTADFTVTHVYVLGPLYPRQQKGYFDRSPDTRLSATQFRTPFRRFDDPDSPQFAGYWVTVSP